MNDSTTLSRLAAVLLLTAGFLASAGCKKSSSADEAKITGKKTDPPVEMQPRWKAGNRYKLRLDSNQTMEFNQGPQPGSQETVISQDYSVVVTNASDGQRGLELEMEALAVDVHAGERNVYHFDSLNKAVANDGPGVDMLSRVIGGKIRFLLDSNNTVAKVDGIKELIDRAQGDTGAGAPDQRRQWMGGMLERVFNADYFKQLVDLSALPRSATRIGDNWVRQQEIDVGMVGRVVVNTTNTFRGWQEHEGKKCARIEFTGTLAMKTGKAEGILALMGMSLQDGRMSGRSWFEPTLGLPLETVVEQSVMLSGSMPRMGPRGNAPGRGTNQGPAKFSAPWRQSMSIKLSEAEPVTAPK